MQLVIDRTWDGLPAEPAERATIELVRTREHLLVRVDATFHDDPPPPGAAGPTDGLWEYEAVELFLLAPPAHYLEIELGPHGHHLALELQGVRRTLRQGMPLDYTASRTGRRWQGEARIPLGWLPGGVTGAMHANAYALHGTGSARRHLAWQPVPGDAPDFHRLECFATLALDALPEP